MKPVVLLDLDNTILDFNTAECTALCRTFEMLRVPYDEEMLSRYHVINIRHWEMLEDGILTREEVLVRRFEELYRERGIQCDAVQTRQLYESLLAEGHWFMPGAEEMLKELCGPYRLFICSNGTKSVQAGRMKSAGIAPYFEKVFISEEIGWDKPGKEYFECCFQQIEDFDRNRAIMVGDSLTSDIRGGLNAGVLTCWYNPGHAANPGVIVPDFEITALSDLKPLLQSIFT